MIRLQQIAVTNEYVSVTYVEEAEIHLDSGIIEARNIEIPHDVLPQSLLDELIDCAVQIIDHARAVRRMPVGEFRGLRSQ
jgi:hypothetical protein